MVTEELEEYELAYIEVDYQDTGQHDPMESWYQEENVMGPEIHLTSWVKKAHHFSARLSQKIPSGRLQTYV